MTLHGNIDSPTNGQAVVGDMLITGWALSRNAPLAHVQLLLNDQPLNFSLHRFPRHDVIGIFSSFVSNKTPGFHMQVNTRSISNGDYTLTALMWSGDDAKILGSLQIQIDNPASGYEDLPYGAGFAMWEREGQIPHREQIYGSGPPSPLPSPEALGLLQRFAGQTCLDVGCGIGAYMGALKSDGRTVKGIEVVPEFVTMARSKGLDVDMGDALNLHFPDSSFDTVYMIEVLEHIPDPERVLSEVYRVARKNVVISVPNSEAIPYLNPYLVVPWHLLEGTHVNFFTPGIMRAALNKITPDNEVSTYGQFAWFVAGREIHNHVFAVIHKSRS